MSERFVGFDAAGEAFLSEGRVLRGIYPGHGAAYRDILTTCEQENLFRLGIVGTRALPDPHPTLAYDLVFEHDRVPFVTYPHEWSASMLKDAALFHIRLFEELSPHGLTLKDWHPYNILFRATKPVFVDFTSLIRREDLSREQYLTPDRKMARRYRWDTTASYVYEMYRRMYVPYFLMPLYLMAQGRYAVARRRMLATALNAATTTIVPSEVFDGSPLRRLSYELGERRKRIALAEPGDAKRDFFALLRTEVQALNVSVDASAYSSYYEAKGERVSYEPSPNWTPKHTVVFEALQRFHPATVLDVGSNTGWFSELAARHGASVVAVDLDEACIDILYRHSDAENLSILPLVMNIADPTPSVAAREYPDEPSLSLIGGDAPLLRAAPDRLACDMVFALALVHHLVLGRGASIEHTAAMLSQYANHSLVVEFVSLDDALIKEDPTFFPAYVARPAEFAGYTLDGFIEALTAHFSDIQRRPSTPDTRTLLICSK